MSLLANVNQPNENGYYFALDTNPAPGGIVDAEAFRASGGPDTQPYGFYIARGDASGAPVPLFQMRKQGEFANLQWTIGMATAPAGANSGNNMVFSAYSDGGAFLSAPMTIERDNGEVQINNLNAGTLLVPGTTSTTTLNVTTGGATVGATSMAGGGVINVLGTAGPSRVFDASYNPPVIGTDSLIFSQGADGTIATDVAFTPSITGTYVLSATVNGVGSGWSWAAGNSLNFVLLNGSNVVPGAQIYVAGLVDPTGMAARGNLAADTFEYQIDILVSLTAGVSYDIERGTTGPAYNLGAGGSVGIIVANLNA